MPHRRTFVLSIISSCLILTGFFSGCGWQKNRVHNEVMGYSIQLPDFWAKSKSHSLNYDVYASPSGGARDFYGAEISVGLTMAGRDTTIMSERRRILRTNQPIQEQGRIMIAGRHAEWLVYRLGDITTMHYLIEVEERDLVYNVYCSASQSFSEYRLAFDTAVKSIRFDAMKKK